MDKDEEVRRLFQLSDSLYELAHNMEELTRSIKITQARIKAENETSIGET